VHWRPTSPHSNFSVDVRKLPSMRKAVKKMITLPADLAAQVEAIAHDENKSFGSVVQEALRALIRSRMREEFRELQDYWSTCARAKGVRSQRNLGRLLRRRLLDQGPLR
jgi:hypothetical protein